jgi:hypothetical protein
MGTACQGRFLEIIEIYGEFLIVATVIVFRNKSDGNKQKEEAKGRNCGLIN